MPKDPLEKMMAVGVRAGVKNPKSKRRYAKVGVLSKIAAANFHSFPSSAFSGEIASVCGKRTGEGTGTPTAPHLSEPIPFCKDTLMHWGCAGIYLNAFLRLAAFIYQWKHASEQKRLVILLP